MFGAKPATSIAGFGSSFGAPTLSNTLATSKPLSVGFGTNTNTSFGSTPAPTFGAGTGSLFGGQNQQAAKPFSFSTPFSSQPQASQPSFGKASVCYFLKLCSKVLEFSAVRRRSQFNLIIFW
jgi:hypothetical protein